MTIFRIASFFWDPPREFLPFNLPLLGRPILWYGVLFALGCIVSYFLFLNMTKKILKEKARAYCDKLLVYVAVGTVLGAKMGDLIFYQRWQGDILALFRFWEGGLASHGAAVGILFALFLFWRKERSLPFLTLLDHVGIVVPLAGAFIRMGNFINQEILGTVTSVPWGVIFGHPMDQTLPVARHPVQLYEALLYLAIFGILYALYRKKGLEAPGRFFGLFLVAVFGGRFFLEFYKAEMSVHIAGSSLLHMGHFLSLPLIALGTFFLVRSGKKRDKLVK